MPLHQGLYYQQWGKCDRCYRTNPIGRLSMQLGLLLCPDCIDNLDVENRPKVIAEILSDGSETEDQLTNIGDNPNVLEF